MKELDTELGLNESYADQTGHRLRGMHNELTKYFEMPPKCLGTVIIEDNKRRMKRMPNTGKK